VPKRNIGAMQVPNYTYKYFSDHELGLRAMIRPTYGTGVQGIILPKDRIRKTRWIQGFPLRIKIVTELLPR